MFFFFMKNRQAFVGFVFITTATAVKQTGEKRSALPFPCVQHPWGQILYYAVYWVASEKKTSSAKNYRLDHLFKIVFPITMVQVYSI